MRLVFEWDEAGDEYALAMGCADPEGRNLAYGAVSSLGSAAERLGVELELEELTERYRAVCGVTGMALVWRGRVVGGGGAGDLAQVVLGGLGVQGPDELI